MTIIELLEGPLLIISAAVFVIFGGWRLISILTTGRTHTEARPASRPGLGALHLILSHFLPRKGFRRNGKVWFVTVAGYAFHLGLFALLLFAAPHVAFFREHVADIALPVLPRWAFIIAAEFAFAGLLVLWIRRFLDPVVRLISRPDDHMAAGLTFAVMLTGCMALGEQSTTLRAIHLGSVEIWLLYFPFSSLMHSFTWPLSRAYTGALAARRGTRM